MKRTKSQLEAEFFVFKPWFAHTRGTWNNSCVVTLHNGFTFRELGSNGDADHWLPWMARR